MLPVFSQVTLRAGRLKFKSISDLIYFTLCQSAFLQLISHPFFLRNFRQKPMFPSRGFDESNFVILTKFGSVFLLLPRKTVHQKLPCRLHQPIKLLQNFALFSPCNTFLLVNKRFVKLNKYCGRRVVFSEFESSVKSFLTDVNSYCKTSMILPWICENSV